MTQADVRGSSELLGLASTVIHLCRGKAVRNPLIFTEGARARLTDPRGHAYVLKSSKGCDAPLVELKFDCLPSNPHRGGW